VDKYLIDVALSPAEIRRISALDLSGVTAVVFDVLRATSSIITGLAAGAEEIIPVRTVEEARKLKLNDSGLLLAGERDGFPPEGFDLGNSPEEFEQIKGRRVAMTTTNGTVAIEAMKVAAKVLVGSLLNIDALADYLFRHRPRSLLLVCAGTGEEFSLEDAIGAGALVARLPDDEGLTDAAIFVRSLYERIGDDVLEWLRQTKNGKHLQKIGKDADIRRCAQLSVFDVVGHLEGESIVRL
jgi:2-phosphosulfolactate phosphatase